MGAAESRNWQYTAALGRVPAFPSISSSVSQVPLSADAGTPPRVPTMVPTAASNARQAPIGMASMRARCL